MHALGADHVIDYKVEDFTQSGIQYDLILAVNGFHPIEEYLRALKPTGSYVVAGGSMRQLIQAGSIGIGVSRIGGQKTMVLSMVQSQKDMILLKELLESRKIVPIIDRCYQLSKIVEAFWYFEKEHAKGKWSSSWSMMKVNRLHKIIETGLYKFIRHPGYLGQ